jgi:hypothetical protein
MSKVDDKNKVAVGAVIRFAYRSVFGRLGLILEIGWIPLLALLAALILPGILAPSRYGASALEFGALDYAEALIVILSLSAFAVRWHQSILVGDPRRLPVASFFQSWLRFLAYMIAVYVVLGGVLALAMIALPYVTANDLAMALIELGAVIAGTAMAVVVLRFGLLFPAAARGEPLTPLAAWRLMRGNSWRLAFASLLTALPVTITTGFVTGVLVAASLPKNVEDVAAPPLGVLILAGLLETTADVVLVALGASVLSAFYQEIVLRRGAVQPSA